MATSSHKRVHASTVFRTPTKSRPLTWLEPHTLPRAEPLSRSHSSSTSSHPQGRSAKRWARSAHLHEIKILRELRGSGGAKRAMVFKDWENDRENVALGDMFNDFSSSSALSLPHLPARIRAPDELRRPLTPMVVVRSSLEEGGDGDAWVDTDVDEDDLSVVSERAVVLNSPERDVFV